MKRNNTISNSQNEVTENLLPSSDNVVELGSSTKRFKAAYLATSSSGPVNRSDISPGTANHVVINNGTGVLSSEAALSSSRGGFGQSMASANGYALFGGGNVIQVGNIPNSNTTATSANTANAIVSRSATGQVDVSTVDLNGASNQLIFQPNGTGNTIALNVSTAPTANRVFTLPDLADASFMMTTGAQVLNNKTFSSAVTVTPSTNQLVLGVTRTTTINAVQPATASRTHTIPDVSANSNFVMSEGLQTVNRNKTFTGQTTFQTNPVIVTGGLNTSQFARVILVTSNFITSGATTITAAMILGGLIQVGDRGTNFSATTDTATNIVNSIPSAERAIGVSIRCFVVNNSIRVLTSILAGTGVTIALGDNGNLNNGTRGRMLYFVVTNVATPAVTVFG